MAPVTPKGRFLGRKKDARDPRDRRLMARQGLLSITPPSIDLRDKLPPVFDQSALGSCGPNSADGFMCFMFPELAAKGFSRLQLYFDVRTMEGQVNEDSGVETRDLFKALCATGMATEDFWPYSISQFTAKPSPSCYANAGKQKLSGYSRLASSDEAISCLAGGSPFVLGFDVPQELDSDLCDNTSVMTYPVPGDGIGGHDVLVVGYDLNFKVNPTFKSSGIDPSKVSNHALLIRNSWGGDWSKKERGHFWAPMDYMIQDSDCWTGHL